ncbi:MAG: S1 RNA-binding domain-containing protein, partial [Planctomycetota bacterium]
ENKIGEELDAVVTGVMNFGVFVRGTKLPAEGLIPREALGGGWFDHDATAHTLTSRDGVMYRLGMPIRVKVSAVDVEGRTLQFALNETPEPSAGARPGEQWKTAGQRAGRSDRDRPAERSKRRGAAKGKARVKGKARRRSKAKTKAKRA